MAHTQPSDELARAQDFYARRLKIGLEPAQNGRFVCIDLETGDYYVADRAAQAGRLHRQRHPDRLGYILRIGGGPVVRLGARISP